MDNKIVYLTALITMLCLAGLVSAQDIPNPLEYNDFVSLLNAIVVYVGSFIAVLGTIMIIIAGFLYLTSAGDPKRVETAKTALIYAVVGIAIGLAAGAISYTIQQVLGVQ